MNERKICLNALRWTHGRADARSVGFFTGLCIMFVFFSLLMNRYFPRRLSRHSGSGFRPLRRRCRRRFEIIELTKPEKRKGGRGDCVRNWQVKEWTNERMSEWMSQRSWVEIFELNCKKHRHTPFVSASVSRAGGASTVFAALILGLMSEP